MKMMCDASKLLIFLMISFSFETPFGQPPDPDPDPDSDSTWLIYSNSFALELISKTQNITALAQRYGFHLITKHQYFNVYRMVHPEIPVLSKRKARKFLARLKNDSRVKHVSQLQQLLRTRRGSHIYDSQKFSNGNTTERHKSSIKTADEVQKNRNFTDPYFIDQWYLNNAGDVTDDSRFNLNVIPAWNKNITGTGVRICVLDDGIDYRHPDIARNYDAKASTDLNGEFGDSDPMPDDSNPKNSHGTHCAGVAAAEANNGVCGVGVAYHASIGGIRMLDGIITDLLEAEAMLFKPDYIDIYTASWGPVDDGIRMEGPGTFTKQALQTGVQQGRNGLGSIYVWAAGNGGNRFDDCNADGYVGSIETIAVGSVSDKGLKPTFMEECPSILAVVPTGDEPAKHAKEAKKEKIQVVTTGLHGSCTEHFAGTSAAAPLAAGCIALVLQANPLLTWRDAQHIVVRGARMTPIKDSWSKNGAGIHFSNSFGFGVMDCSRMVELAEDWQNVPVALNHSYSSRVLERKISYATPIVMNVSFSGDSLEMNHLEHVQLYIKLQHSCRGEVQIFLTSPSATKSQMLSPRKLDCSKDGIDFHFLSVYYWDEDPQGNWKLQVFDTQDNDNNGVLIEWKIILHGYMKDMKVNTSGSKLTPEDIRPIIKGENSVTKSVNVFSPKLEIKHNLRPVKRTKGNRLSESYKPESIMTRQIKFGNPNVEVESYNKQKLNKGGDNTFSKKRSFLWRLTELQQTDERDINIQSKSFYQRLRLKSMMSSESLKNGKIDIFSWVSNFKVCKDKANNLARNINCNYFNRLYRLLIELMNTNNSQQNFSNKNVFHLKNSNNKFNISTTKSNSLRYRQVGKYIAERMLHKDDTSGATISPQHKPKPSIGEVKSQVDDKILLGNIIKRLRQLIHIEYNIEYVKDSVSLKSSDIARNLNKIDVKNTKVQHSDNNTYQNTWNKLFSMKKEPMLEEELQVLQLQQSERL